MALNHWLYITCWLLQTGFLVGLSMKGITNSPVMMDSVRRTVWSSEEHSHIRPKEAATPQHSTGMTASVRSSILTSVKGSNLEVRNKCLMFAYQIRLYIYITVIYLQSICSYEYMLYKLLCHFCVIFYVKHKVCRFDDHRPVCTRKYGLSVIWVFEYTERVQPVQIQNH